MLIDNLVTRYPGGVGNVPVSDIFASLMEPDMSDFIRDFTEFDHYLVTDWATGGVGAGTTAVQAGLGGLLRLTNAAADNDNRYIQRNNPNFQIVAGKKLFFQARIAQISDATQSDFSIGLQIAVAANDFLTPANGIFFRKDDGAATIAFVSRAATVETTSGALGVTIAAATSYRFQFYYDGGVDLWAGINGTVLARITPVALPSVLMGPTIGVQNGEAVAKNMDIDQILVLQER
jgi:hypothetical protein